MNDLYNLDCFKIKEYSIFFAGYEIESFIIENSELNNNEIIIKFFDKINDEILGKYQNEKTFKVIKEKINDYELNKKISFVKKNKYLFDIDLNEI